MSAPSISNGSEDLEATCASLRHQLNSVLVLLLVVSATSTVYFVRQATELGRQRDAIRRVVTEYNQTSAPVLNEFTAKLREYARTHPEVVPILTKYGVPQVNDSAAPAAPAATPR